MTLPDETIGRLMAENGVLRAELKKLDTKVEQLLAAQREDEKQSAVTRFIFRAGAGLVGLIATLALGTASWALARSNEITVLETEQAAIHATDTRQDGQLHELGQDVSGVQQDIAAIRTNVENLSTLAHTQNENLEALLAQRRR